MLAPSARSTVSAALAFETVDGLVKLAERVVEHDRQAAHHGPNRTRAKVVGDDGRERSVNVTRRPCLSDLCSYRGPHGLAYSSNATVEFVGDSKRSTPCPKCGRQVWRD